MQPDANADESRENVVSIAGFQTKRFFEDIRDQPFIAVTVSLDGSTCVYVKADVSDEDLRSMVQALNDIDPDRE